jgi:hypothetical protein
MSPSKNKKKGEKKEPSAREIIEQLVKPLPQIPQVPEDIRVALADRILRDDECCLEGIEHILTHVEMKITIHPEEKKSESSSSDAPPVSDKPVEIVQGMYMLHLINRAGMTPEKINYVKIMFLAGLVNMAIEEHTRVCKHAFQLYPSYRDLSSEKLAESIKNMVINGHKNDYKDPNIQPVPQGIDIEKLPEPKTEDEKLVPPTSYSIDYGYEVTDPFKRTQEYKRWVRENFQLAREQCARMGDNRTIKEQLFKLVVSGFSPVCKSPSQFFFVNCCKSPHSPKGIEFLDLWELVAEKHPDKTYRMFFGKEDLSQPDVKKQWLVPKKKKFNRWTQPELYKKTVDALAKPQLPFYIPGYIQTDWCTNHILTEPNSGSVYITQSEAGILDTIVISFSDEEWTHPTDGVHKRTWEYYCQFTKWLRDNQDEEVERYKSKVTEAEQQKLAEQVATSADALAAYSKMMNEISQASSSSSSTTPPPPPSPQETNSVAVAVTETEIPSD